MSPELPTPQDKNGNGYADWAEEAARQTQEGFNNLAAKAKSLADWLFNEGALETDESGRVHGDLPNADDIPDNAVDDSIGALNDSIGTREKELAEHPVGDKNGTAKERRQDRQHENHKERIRREEKLKERLEERQRQ